MKPFKIVLHILITLASVFGFLSGWMMLAHSRKPVQAASPVGSLAPLAPLPALQPLQPIQTFNSSSSSVQLIQPLAPQTSFIPAFVTRGS